MTPTEERLAITIDAILGFYSTGDAGRDRQSAAVIAKAMLGDLGIERIEREALSLGWKAAGGVIIDDKEVPDACKRALEGRGVSSVEGEEVMTPTDREEAVALAINNMDWSQLDHGIAPSNEEIARAAIAALDIGQIEREAYERGVTAGMIDARRILESRVQDRLLTEALASIEVIHEGDVSIVTGPMGTMRIHNPLVEDGEVAQAALHDEFGGDHAGTLRTELVQLAAVIVQWIEHIDMEASDAD